MIELNKIYNEDCLVTIDNLPKECLDLVITSPPYNVDLGNNKFHKNPYDIYNDNKNHKDYILWLKEIFFKLYDKLKDGGRICINIGDGKNGKIVSHSDIIQFMKEKYLVYTIIIWNKSQIGNRTSWGSFKSPSSPSFPTPFEYILVFSKNTHKLQYKGETDLTKQEFIDWSLAHWTMAHQNNQKKIGHNAMFPIELPKRCMKLFSWMDSIVYDPFMGSGTTALVCIQNNRNYIGSEISENYCNIAKERIGKCQKQN